METAIIIRNARTNLMESAYEESQKDWADKLVEIHNKHFPNDQWYVSAELI